MAIAGGVVVDRGFVNGIGYRVWQRNRDGKKFVFVGCDSKRRNIGWLKKQKRLEESNDQDTGQDYTSL